MVLFCSNEKFFINILVQKYRFGRKSQKKSRFFCGYHNKKIFNIKVFFYLIILAVPDLLTTFAENKNIVLYNYDVI